MGPDIGQAMKHSFPLSSICPSCSSRSAEWLRTNAPMGTTIRCQHSAQLDANVEMKIRIDIVICDERSQQPIAVLDTKYKSNEQPSESDIHQIAFYARASSRSRYARLSIGAGEPFPYGSRKEYPHRKPCI